MKCFFIGIFLFAAAWHTSAQVIESQVDSSSNYPECSTGLDSVLKPPFKPFYVRQLYAPAGLIMTGIVSTTLFTAQLKHKLVSERSEHFRNFHTHIDDYLQYVPVPIAYGLDALGIPSKNDIFNRSLILLKGEALMFVSVNILKYTVREPRPDGGGRHSFPSGHTAQAFAAATFLSEEYKDRFPWMPYVAYSMAGATGLLRMANNRHYIGDVLMGAGLGILSMKIAYWTHQYRWPRKRRLH